MRYISIILVDSALRKERQMTYETYREKANDMALEIEELHGKVAELERIIAQQQETIDTYHKLFAISEESNDSKL